MNKYKVCVYAISKNEEKFVERWYESVKEADEIYVLDTGSKDNTVKYLKKLGINVKKKKYKHFRFDIARNDSLSLVPLDTDICVCCDLDEVFNKGWRKELEEAWDKDTTRASYNYNWSLDEENKPIISFYIEKIHSRKDYTWYHPVHEVLKYIGGKEENKIKVEGITLNHYPDRNKSRSSYLPLLELSVREDPFDDRNMHYLGREYMYYGRYNEAIDTLIKHLSLDNATWKDERCASMRFISRCYKELGRIDEARLWLDKAINEAPYLRDAYMEKAVFEYELNNYSEVEKYSLLALNIKEIPKTYINEPFSLDSYIYDLLSVACFNLGKYIDAYKYVCIALSLNPKDKRIRDNLILMYEKIKKD